MTVDYHVTFPEWALAVFVLMWLVLILVWIASIWRMR